MADNDILDKDDQQILIYFMLKAISFSFHIMKEAGVSINLKGQ